MTLVHNVSHMSLWQTGYIDHIYTWHTCTTQAQRMPAPHAGTPGTPITETHTLTHTHTPCTYVPQKQTKHLYHSWVIHTGILHTNTTQLHYIYTCTHTHLHHTSITHITHIHSTRRQALTYTPHTSTTYLHPMVPTPAPHTCMHTHMPPVHRVHSLSAPHPLSCRFQATGCYHLALETLHHPFPLFPCPLSSS